ncbi:MAG TPA: hypothetical protein PLN38_07495 [Chitinophagales bacterium]|nr:hypothetical protein [Chitinophagales bacterium]
MNSKEKELLNAINGTERMSGFDSYDGDMSYFDDMDDFDGDDQSYADGDGMSYAGGNQAVAVSDPYVVQYANNCAVATTAVLFGYNDFGTATNYGNSTNITITNVQTGAVGTAAGGYSRIISQSNNKFFKIGKWRFQSTTTGQLQVTLNIYHVDANGKQYVTPLNLSIMRDAYQQQSDIIDVTKQVTVDGNTYCTFTLLASSTIVISMFPIAVISGKAKLNGGHSVNSARAPRLSGKNVAPVVIQTTQNVKGIAKG